MLYLLLTYYLIEHVFNFHYLFIIYNYYLSVYSIGFNIYPSYTYILCDKTSFKLSLANNLINRYLGYFDPNILNSFIGVPAIHTYSLSGKNVIHLIFTLNKLRNFTIIINFHYIFKSHFFNTKYSN